MNRRTDKTVTWLVASAALVVGALTEGRAAAATVTLAPPDFDRWNYPFNGSNGIAPVAPTFGAIGDARFDNRDGQFLLGFDTSADLPPLGAGLIYQINAARVTATHAIGTFTYDPTYDSFKTHLDSGDPDFLADGDTGRPVILSGSSLRSGFSFFSFGPPVPGPPGYEQDEAYGFGSPLTPRIRNAFAFTPDAPGNGDISNNVTDRFDIVPFAVGTTNLNPADAAVEGVPGTSAGSTFTFDVDLADPDIRAYIEDGIDEGSLFFTISSLHVVAQGGSTRPGFYTSGNFDPAAITPTVTLDFSVASVPLPAGGIAGGVLLAAAAAWSRFRMSNRKR